MSKTVISILNLLEKTISDARICESGSPKMMNTGGNDAKINQVCQNHHPLG
jgi:hypothetical protein